MKQALIVVLVALTCVNVYARLGYTENQCNNKYGVFTQNPGNDILRFYDVGGMELACWFFNGECGQIRYELGKNSPKEEDLKKLMSINGGTDRWMESDDLQWVSRSKLNRKRAKLWYRSQHDKWYFVVWTDEFDKWFYEKTKKENTDRSTTIFDDL